VRFLTLLSIVGALLVSGCAGAPRATEAGSLVQLEEGGGQIVGTVVSSETLPIVGALVAAEGAPPTTTDEAGHFRIPGLVPGTYELQAQALGYASAARRVDVLEGETTDVLFTLELIPVEVPRTELLIFKGFSICDYMLYLFTGRIPSPCDSSQAKTQFSVKVDGAWQFVVAEMKWQGGFANSDTFRLFLSDDGDCTSGSPCYGLLYGNGYIRLEGEPGDTDLVKYYDPWMDDRGPGYPAVENGSFEMFLNGQWVGALVDQLGDNPTCQPLSQTAAGSGYKPGCVGVGVSTGIAYDAYASVFYLQQPAPRGPCCPATTYSAIPDG
jgi:hypothetical protein